MIIGLAAVRLSSGLVAGRGVPRFDGPLVALAGAFLLLCWLSTAWSIVPLQSVKAALGISGVLLGLLVLWARRDEPPETSEILFRVMTVAMLVGVAAACVDIETGFHVESLVGTPPGVRGATNYNRGFDYLVLIAWPVLAHAWWRHRRWAVAALALALAAVAVITLSLAARVAVAVGLAMLLLTLAMPRLIDRMLSWVVVTLVAVLPAALAVLSNYRTLLAPYLKPSGVNRLEIWNYMTARVFDRPLLGWGLNSAKHVPIRPAELAHYIYVTTNGTYPHNQWLELWVELGVVGVAAGLIFAVLALRRIRALPQPLRPFAFAAFGSAMTVASVNYEIFTDSWWCALAASAVLFSMLGRAAVSWPGRPGQDRP